MTKQKIPADAKKKEQAAKKAEKWAGAGAEAFNLAKDVEKAKIDGTKVPITAKNIATTIRGAVKMFLDGDISEKNKKILMAAGLDMDNFRKSIVEETLCHILPNVINTGNIDKLAQIGSLGGEPTDPIAAGLPGESIRYITKEEADAVKNHIDMVVEPLKITKKDE